MVQVTPQGVEVIKSLIFSNNQNSNIPAAIEKAHVLCERTESDQAGHTRKEEDETEHTEEIQDNFLSSIVNGIQNSVCIWFLLRFPNHRGCSWRQEVLEMVVVSKFENGLPKGDLGTQHASQDGPAYGVIIRHRNLKERNESILNRNTMSRHGPLCGRHSMVSAGSRCATEQDTRKTCCILDFFHKILKSNCIDFRLLSARIIGPQQFVLVDDGNKHFLQDSIFHGLGIRQSICSNKPRNDQPLEVSRIGSVIKYGERTLFNFHSGDAGCTFLPRFTHKLALLSQKGE